MNKRCVECGLFSCKHLNITSVNGRTGDIALGEPVGEPIRSSVSSKEHKVWCQRCVSWVTERGEPCQLADILQNDKPCASSRKPLPMPTRVLIPPTNTDKPDMNTLQKRNTENDWVNCSICKNKVLISYLDQHLKVHTKNYEPTSTALVRVPTSTTTELATERPKPKFEKKEHYKFRPLDQVCFASTSSKNGRYSDFTIIFWEQERTSVQTTSYMGGGNSYLSKEWERFSIHVVYDSMEDYYVVSPKLLKRSGYSTYDSEESIPDRICFQEELFTEIKRALLFFKISPKTAYRAFRKLMKDEFIISYEDNKALVCQTKNCETLSERLKKAHNDHESHNRHYGHGYEGI
jgi:hypothetical protein